MKDRTAMVRSAAAGDDDSWRDLTASYNGMLRNIGRNFRLSHEQVDDAMQETWLQLYRHIGGLRDAECVGGWLAKAMSRECMRARQPIAREVLCGDWSTWPQTDSLADVEERLLEQERHVLVHRAVIRLPARQREVVTALTRCDSYARIGELLEMPVGSIGPTRARALRRLRAQLEADEGGA